MERKLFAIFQFAVSVSAIAGSLALFGRFHPPLEWLAGSPFHSYLIPGVILLFAIGGSYLLAGITLWRRSKFSSEISATAGFTMLIWIFVQISVIKHTSWLQSFYFAVGLLTLTSAFYLMRYKDQGT